MRTAGTAVGVVALLFCSASSRMLVQAAQQPTFRVSIDLVSTDAIPRNSRSQQFMNRKSS